jgi:hypothetical protein
VWDSQWTGLCIVQNIPALYHLLRAANAVGKYDDVGDEVWSSQESVIGPANLITPARFDSYSAAQEHVKRAYTVPARRALYTAHNGYSFFDATIAHAANPEPSTARSTEDSPTDSTPKTSPKLSATRLAMLLSAVGRLQEGRQPITCGGIRTMIADGGCGVEATKATLNGWASLTDGDIAGWLKRDTVKARISSNAASAQVRIFQAFVDY